MPIVAVVFDFDDTLMPDSTTALLTSFDIDVEEFWRTRAPALVSKGYDPPMAYLRLILELVGDGKPLGRLSNKDLAKFGATLDDRYFSGIPDVFDDLNALVKDVRDVSVEFYIVSSGIQDLIKGSAIVQNYFSGVYACQLDDEDEGYVQHVKRCVTFTEKTRFLFEINKGIEQEDSESKPGLVNEDIPEKDRRVPFSNMIYAGDGLTDIPCFSLVQKNGGTAFGIFDPSNEASAKKAFQDFLQAGRVASSHAARFKAVDELGSLLRVAVSSKAANIAVRRGTA